MVGMLAAENPSVEGHLAASTPRRRGNATALNAIKAHICLHVYHRQSTVLS